MGNVYHMVCMKLNFFYLPFKILQLQKGDIVTNLQSRLAIICDEDETISNVIADGGIVESIHETSRKKLVPQLDLQVLRKQCSLAFPRSLCSMVGGYMYL